MVISKCVPLEISRKKFSKFVAHLTPEDMIFVGYKENDDNTKTNIKMSYDVIKDNIKDDIIKYIEENGIVIPPGGGDTPDNPDVPTPDDSPSTAVKINEVYFYRLIKEAEEGQVPTWDDEAQTHIINLGKQAGCLEINAGGEYLEDYIYFANPVVGSITNVIVDNTGLPNKETAEVEPPIEGTEFKLYYGSHSYDDYGNPLWYEILSVPPYCMGVAQILHTETRDLIINSTYTPAYYVEDVKPVITEDDNGSAIDHSDELEEETNSFNIDMENEKAFLEFKPTTYDDYTFWFSNPELGSMTYIVINNSEDFTHPVTINYGKRIVDGSGIVNDRWYPITEVEEETAVIEVFHSLSADIVVKVTKI